MSPDLWGVPFSTQPNFSCTLYISCNFPRLPEVPPSATLKSWLKPKPLSELPAIQKTSQLSQMLQISTQTHQLRLGRGGFLKVQHDERGVGRFIWRGMLFFSSCHPKNLFNYTCRLPTKLNIAPERRWSGSWINRWSQLPPPSPWNESQQWMRWDPHHLSVLTGGVPVEN